MSAVAAPAKHTWFADLVDWIADFLTGEWLIRRVGTGGNSSGIVLLRTVWSGLLLYCVAVLLYASLDESRMSWQVIRSASFKTLPWLGAFLAGAYASLYARFAAHWEYLSKVYNDIKACEVSIVASGAAGNSKKLAEWKAGFVEDVDDLRLVGSPMFASIIVAWKDDTEVSDAFHSFSFGGASRWTRVLQTAAAALARNESQRSKGMLPPGGP